VDGLEHGSEGFGIGGHGNQVDVVGHQAIRPYGQPTHGRVLAEEFQIPVPLLVAMEDILPAIATLGYMMRPAGNHDSGSARHAKYLWNSYHPVKGKDRRFK
jgi:hypothetical protein